MKTIPSRIKYPIIYQLIKIIEKAFNIKLVNFWSGNKLYFKCNTFNIGRPNTYKNYCYRIKFVKIVDCNYHEVIIK